jgi:uncharacterized membrane protein
VNESLKGFLQIGMFVGICGLLMVFVQPPGSAEFVLSVCSALLGAILVLGAVLLSRILR